MARRMKTSGIDWIGVIPEDWEIKSIKNILQERKETNNPIKTKEILSLTNDRGVIPYSEKGDVGNKSKDDISGYKIAYVNDIVLNSMNVVIGSVGISKYFGAVSPVYYMLYTRNNNDCIRYFNNIFQTKEFQKKLIGYGNGIMEIRMRIQMSKLNTIALPYPSEIEQQAIADYLDRKSDLIDNTIEKQKTVIEKLKLYKQSVITEAVTKGLDPSVTMKPSGIEWIGDIPEGWKIVRIKNIVTLNPSYIESFENGTNVSFSPMEFIGQGKMETSVIDIEKVKSGYTYFTNGDVIMAKVTPCFENGNIALAKNLLNGVGYGSSELYVFRCKKVNNTFLFYFLQNFIFKNNCTSSMYGAGGLKRVPAQFINSYKLALPPLPEQQAIVDYLDQKCTQIDNIIEQKQKLIERLANYKKSLIYECVTGKREVMAG